MATLIWIIVRHKGGDYMGKRKNNFNESLIDNVYTLEQYISILQGIAISMFEWKNVPDSIDTRYIERSLFREGSAIYFNDEVLNEDLCLSMISQGQFDVYGVPVKRMAFSKYNNYQKELNKENSVVIWNNLDRLPSYPIIMCLANRLYNLDRIIDVNANAQKTPILIRCDEKQRLTLKNAFKEFNGNSPVIYADNNFDPESLTVLKTDAPYISDKIYDLKTNLWNEALTYLGIPSANVMKKERLIKDEVLRGLGGTLANRYSRLEARQHAVEQINKMFGTNIEVGIREEIDELGKYEPVIGGDNIE